MDRCGDKCTNSKIFWKIVKPLISHKHHGGGSDIVLLENSDVINEQNQVCDVFNQYYTCVNSSGSSVLLEGVDDQSNLAGIVEDFRHHPSATYMKNGLSGESFSCGKVTTYDVFKILKSLKSNKATGCDNILSKLLTIGASFLCESLRGTTTVSRMFIETSVFRIL